MLLKIWNAIRLNIGILHLIVDVWKIRCLALSINDLCLGSFLWLCHDLILNVMLCSLPLRFEICSNCSGNTIVLLFSKENLVVSISLFLCFGSINVCTIFFFFLQKKSFYRKEKNPGNAFVIDLPLCPIHKCRSWFILFTLSSTIYVVSLVNSSLNLETAHIFLSSHHLAFSGRHVLYFKWVSINMKYQYWWYHTVMHLYWGSNKLNSRV